MLKPVPTPSPEPVTNLNVLIKLVHTANLISRPYYHTVQKQHGVTLNQWRLLRTIANAPGINAASIGEITGIHVMNISRGLKSLVKQGLIERVSDESDKRSSNLFLTEAGTAIYDVLIVAQNERGQFILDGISAEEIENIEPILDKLIEHLKTEVY